MTRCGWCGRTLPTQCGTCEDLTGEKCSVEKDAISQYEQEEQFYEDEGEGY